MAKSNYYFINFTTEYVYKVFNFENGALIFGRVLCSLIYLYLCFFVAYFTKIKYIVLIFIYLRGLFAAVYACILFCLGALSGIVVCVFVFIPTTLLSVFLCYFVCDCCADINKKYILYFPAIFAAVDAVTLVVFVNVVFRVVILIV